MSVWSNECMKEAQKKFKKNVLLNTESLYDFFDVAIEFAYVKKKRYLVSILEVSKRNKSVNQIFKDNSKSTEFKTLAYFFDKKVKERQAYEKKQEDAFKKKLR